MKKVRTTNVMRKSATKPATMNASRYSLTDDRKRRRRGRGRCGRFYRGRHRRRAGDGRGAQGHHDPHDRETQMSPKSSSGVTRPREARLARAFFSLMRAALPILSDK